MSHKHKKKSKQKEGRRNVSNDVGINLPLDDSGMPKTDWPMGTWESHEEPAGNEYNQLD